MKLLRPLLLAGSLCIALSRVWNLLSLYVLYALFTFALQWRTMVRALRGLGGGDSGAHARTEVPGSWFAAAMGSGQ